MYDVIIVGGGSAGLTAALYTARRSLRTLLISKDIGGQAATTTVIENYPGTGPVDGYELMQQFQQQAVQYGTECITGEVNGLAKQPDGSFVVSYNNTSIQARSVILAFGLTPRSLNIPGEQDFIGKGITYSAAANVDELHNKTVAVVGGGNSAIEAVNMLADVAKHVFLVHRRDRFRAEEVLLRKLELRSNVTQVLNAEVVEVKGNDSVEHIVMKIRDQVDTREEAVDALCINVGFMSSTKFLEGLVELSEKNEIIITNKCLTNQPGVFAAGDITTANVKQVVVSAGEGCKAALACYEYLMAKDGKEVKVDQDWDVTSGEHFIRT